MAWRREALWLVASIAVWGCLLSLGWSSGAVFDATAPSMMRDPAYQAAKLRLTTLEEPVVVVIGDATFQDRWTDENAPLHRVIVSQYDLNDLTDALDVILSLPAAQQQPICHIVAQSDPLFALRMRHWGPKLTDLQHLPDRETTLFSLSAIRAAFAHAKAWAATDRRRDPMAIPAARTVTLDGQGRAPDPTNENWTGLMDRAALLQSPLTLVADLDGRAYPEALVTAFAALPQPEDIDLARRPAPTTPAPLNCAE